ncbi:MAG: phospholipase D-like domain-containing protein [Candidatus Bathyarchaeota archaeon]|nr:phospholipase D-like domain-containing protein [Candidatus Bathyarchaeota archaeon]
MKTFSGTNAGSVLLPLFEKAQDSVWVVSPWLSKQYAEFLVQLSRRGLEVRLITSKVDTNLQALDVLRTAQNPNLHFLILENDKASSKAVFVHAKIYLFDKKFGVSGSANLTYSGLHTNVESLNQSETENEFQQLETDFMRLWLKYEKSSVSTEELSSNNRFFIKNGLPLAHSLIQTKSPNRGRLVYCPYYFFEYIFRGSVRSPPLFFEDKGFLVMDAMSRQIVEDNLLAQEIDRTQELDYTLDTEDKYDIEMCQPKISNYREANEIALDFIIKKNTITYQQHYGQRAYDRLYVPRRYDISFLKGKLVQVPFWYITAFEPDRYWHEKTIFASSGNVWKDLLLCPTCNTKTKANKLFYCDGCHKIVCSACGKDKGLFLKKFLCPSCYSKS